MSPHETLTSLWKNLDVDSSTPIHISKKEIMKWFKSVDVYPKLFWKGRDHQDTYCCVGIGENGSTILPTFRVESFDPSQPQWDGFPESLCWTPHGVIQFSTANNSASLHKSAQLNPWVSPTGIIQNHTSTAPNKEDWINSIHQSKQLFQSNVLNKIVLAKESYFEFTDPWDRFESLRAAQPNNYHFLFMPNEHTIFLGVSPEKLFGIHHRALQTEALAGTRETIENIDQNARLMEELSQSNKDQQEHDCVVRYLTEQLEDLSIVHRLHPQEILQLPDVQHLRTPMTFELKEHVSIDDVLNRLHPTPAVCGLPTQRAKETIAKIEPFHRGWYAGTMGIEHQGHCDFTVLIRSALWRKTSEKQHGYAWSGAGIVAQSDPESEWIEVQNKSKQFLQRNHSECLF